jgi:hypothetical protein
MSHFKPLTPNQKTCLIIQLEQTIKQLNATPALKVCENCSHFWSQSARMCVKFGEIPAHYSGHECPQWTEEIPF